MAGLVEGMDDLAFKRQEMVPGRDQKKKKQGKWKREKKKCKVVG